MLSNDQVRELIASECDRIKEMLLSKNEAYGNSMLDPLRIFSKADADAQIDVRLDDKLSRIMRGNGTETEDVVTDMAGYLVGKLVLRRIKEIEDCQLRGRLTKLAGIAHGSRAVPTDSDREIGG